MVHWTEPMSIRFILELTHFVDTQTRVPNQLSYKQRAKDHCWLLLIQSVQPLQFNLENFPLRGHYVKKTS